MERHGLRLLGLRLKREVEQDGEQSPAEETTRAMELVSLAAAITVNCTTSTKRHLEAARRLGISEDDIQEVARLSQFIKGQADSLCCKVL